MVQSVPNYRYGFSQAMNLRDRLRILTNDHRWLLLSLIVAVALRLLFILVVDPNPPLGGGDTGYYLSRGPELVRNIANDVSPAPVYLLYVGTLEILFPSDLTTTIQFFRLLNIVWQLVLIVSVYLLGNRYFERRVAIFAVIVIALSPIFIIETGIVETESVYLGLLFAALALYTLWHSNPTVWRMISLGVVLGIATETRAVLLLFPLILAIHLIRLHGWRSGLRFAGVMLVFYALVVSTWTVYSWARWNHFVIGADGIVDYAWMGFHGQQSPQAVSAAAGNPQSSGEFNQNLASQVADTLLHNLPAYLKTRLTNIVGAYLQPSDTNYLAGNSLKQIAATWLHSDRSLSGLIALTEADAFWPKLALYLFHFWALLGGFIGMILCWRKFWVALPLFGYVLYTTAVHSVLLALPRYLLPVEPILILFASTATLAAIAALAARRQTPAPVLA